jgi:hypothetical protein
MKRAGGAVHIGFTERALRRVVGRELAESAWGDLEEEGQAVADRYGRVAGRLWISLQGLGLIAGLADRSWFSSERWLGEGMMDDWSDGRRRWVAVIGALAALPAALLVGSGLIYSFSGGGAAAQALDSTLYDPQGFVFRVVLHPAVVLGGLLAAVAVNLIPLLRLSFETHAGTVSATLGLRLRPRHLVIAAAGLGLLAMLLVYSITENFAVVAKEGTPTSLVAPATTAIGAGGTGSRPQGPA